MLSSDGFDFELGPEELKLIEEQETQFMTQHHASRFDVEVQVRQLQEQLATLLCELESIKREKIIKDGEVTLLRQKLNSFEAEKYEASRRNAERLAIMEQERQALLLHSQREIERLQTELKFKDNEQKVNTKTFSNKTGSNFVEGFAELKSFQKRLKSIPNFQENSLKKEISIETDILQNSLQLLSLDESGSCQKQINEFELFEILLKSIGYADYIFGGEDLPLSDKEAAQKLRVDLLELASNSNNTLASLDFKYSKVVREDNKPLIYYASLILEFFICLNEKVGEAIIAPVENLVKENFEYSLPDHLCNFLRKIEHGHYFPLIHQHLRILKHLIFYGIPKDHIIQLIEDGTFSSLFKSFYKKQLNDEILIDILQILSMICSDRRFSISFVKQAPSPVDCSILNTLNSILCDQLNKKSRRDSMGNLEKTIFLCLLKLVTTRLLPASVAFEPASLRHLARRLALVVSLERDLEANLLEIFVKIQVFHQVVVIEKAPIVKILNREFYSLYYGCRQIIRSSLNLNQIMDLLKSLLAVLDNHHQDIMKGLYTTISFPIFQKRDIPLSKEEELELYNSKNQ